MGVGDGVGLRSRPRSRSSSACVEFNSKNVVLPTSSRNSRLYARLKTGRLDEDVQKHCDLQDKKHENTVLSGEREAATVRAAMLDFFPDFFSGIWINSGYLLFFETTIMGKTADLAMIQKTNIDALHKEGK